MSVNLVNSLCSATGLPESLVKDELLGLLTKAGKSPESATLDDIRQVMADYLQEVLIKAKEEF